MNMSESSDLADLLIQLLVLNLLAHIQDEFYLVHVL